jgi:hypothetical protein
MFQLMVHRRHLAFTELPKTFLTKVYKHFVPTGLFGDDATLVKTSIRIS